MNSAFIPSRIEWNFRDRDRAAARARLEALAHALERRGVGSHLGECDVGATGHVIALGVGRAPDALVFVALRYEDGHYEGRGSGNPPHWLVAHVESAWLEIS